MDNVNKNGAQYRIGYLLGGPVLSSYSQWVIKQCLKLDIEKLYFVARDGYILKEVTQLLLKKIASPIETHYIFGSRLSWRITDDEQKLYYLTDVFNIEAQFTIKELDKLVKNKWPIEHKEHVNKYLSGGMMKALVLGDILEQNVRHRILYINKKLRQNVKGYFNQEVDLSLDRIALVDIQGTGISYGFLENILHDDLFGTLTPFYCFCSRKLSNESIDLQVMMQNTIKDADKIEMLARAPHHQTIGYIVSKNKYFPEFANDEKLEITKYDYIAYSSGVKDYIEKHFSQIQKLSSSELIQSINFNMEFLKTSEDKEIRAFFSATKQNASQFKGRYVNKKCFSSYSMIRDNIIVYGAGIRGKLLINQLLAMDKKIVGWSDKNHKKFSETAIKVESLDEVLRRSFEQIIISITNPRIAFEVANILIEKGIEKDKILWINANQNMM